MTVSGRTSPHGILQPILDRWSPRSFVTEHLPDDVLNCLLEAARWAPSAFNSQPWRFAWARNNTPEWEPIFSTLSPFNQKWGRSASAILLVASRENFRRTPASPLEESAWHAFDAGAAWAYLALQAHVMGWSTHACGGFDRAAARTALNMPAQLHLHCIVLIGKRGPIEALPADLQDKEFPRDRVPLAEICAHGKFSAD